MWKYDTNIIVVTVQADVQLLLRDVDMRRSFSFSSIRAICHICQLLRSDSLPSDRSATQICIWYGWSHGMKLSISKSRRAKNLNCCRHPNNVVGYQGGDSTFWRPLHFCRIYPRHTTAWASILDYCTTHITSHHTHDRRSVAPRKMQLMSSGAEVKSQVIDLVPKRFKELKFGIQYVCSS